MAFQCIYGRIDEGSEDGDRGREVRFLEKGKQWKLSGLLYADDLDLYCESEEDLTAIGGTICSCVKEKSTESQFR